MVTEQQTYPTMPEGFSGTNPEWAIHWALTRMGIEFDFQSSQLGGRQDRGGAVLDFYLPDLNMGINIQSTYWHYGRPEAIGNDISQREILESMGITMIYIDEEDALRAPFYYANEAILGNDYSRMGGA